MMRVSLEHGIEGKKTLEAIRCTLPTPLPPLLPLPLPVRIAGTADALPAQDGVRFIGHLLSYDTIEAIEAFAILSDLFAAMRGGFDCGRTS